MLRTGRRSLRCPLAAGLLAVGLVLPLPSGTARAQGTLSEFDRARARMMLRGAREDLRRYYYDTTFAGLDLQQRFDSAARRLDRAQSNGEMFGVIAQVFMDLNDSHTWFVPPERASQVRFGWSLLAIGDSVYVAAVRPGSGVDSAGLRPGDRIASVNGYRLTRGNLWKMHYAYLVVRPVAELQVGVESPGGAGRLVTVPADIKHGKARVDLSNGADLRDLYLEWADAELDDREILRERSSGDVLVWDLDDFSIDARVLQGRMRSLRRHQALVLDLRGNPGGYVSTLQRAVGLFLEKEILIATGRTRAKRKVVVDTLRARPVREPFRGRLVVIVDSRSASASEMFARVMQLEGRATVIGDRTAGSVVTSRFFPRAAGGGRMVLYGFSISVRDVVMADGERLEGRGMVPDETVRPTAADLAAARDPVLARAIALAGGSIDPAEAGRLFPVRWAR